MKLLEAEQGTEEWLEARKGIVTASRASRLITTTGKKSTTFEKTVQELVAEKLGATVSIPKTAAMQWGTDHEPQARDYYQFVTGREVSETGLCLLDDGSAGASPDGLMDDRGLEIKCPQPATHVKYLIDGKVPTEYVAQVQMCMWVCERDTWDFVSFHPELPSMLVTAKRDQKFIDQLATYIAEVNEKVSAKTETIMEKYAA